MEASAQASRDVRIGPLTMSMSPNERRKALRSLFVTLSPYELREFRRWIDQVDFRCDLLTKLPLELTHKVLGYLPLHQSFRIRRVSKTWYRMLCAPQTVEYLFRFWYPKAEAKLEVPEGLTLSAVSSSRAEHVDAYRSGSAFSMMRHICGPTYRPSSPENVVYANGFVAWISIGHGLLSYHLESGSYKHWIHSDEEVFSHIAISSSILVTTTTRGRCHVIALADDTRDVFSLASTSVEKITTSGDTVAVLHYDRSRDDGMQVEVTIWTLKSKESIQCRAKLQGPPIGQDSRHDIKIMIGTNLDYLILFERCVNLRSFYFTRFSLDGQLHSQGSLQGPDTATFSRHSESLMPSDVGGCSTIWSYSHKQEVGVGDTDKHSNESDENSAEFLRVQYVPQQNQLRLKADCIPWSFPLKQAKFSIWKDVIYYRTEPFARLHICDLSTSQVARVATMEESDRFVEMRTSCEVFGDENFMVNFRDTGFLAWCFNKETKMDRADETYAQHRQNEIQKRRQRRQEWEAHSLGWILRSEEIDRDITGSVGDYRSLQECENSE